MKRAIVNVSVGNHYVENQKRLNEMLDKVNSKELRIFWTNKLPYGSPTHQETPYAFKMWALREIMFDYDSIIWMDASIVPIKPLEPLWEFIEEQGYWFQKIPFENCGKWTSDAALKPLGIT